MTMPETPWVYRAKIVRAVDGDTIDVVIDAGFRATRTERLRLVGLNCPEVHGATKAAGDAAKAFTQAWLTEAGTTDWPLILRTEKSDAFGRYLARCWRVSDGACLNADLIANGMAVPFMVGAD